VGKLRLQADNISLKEGGTTDLNGLAAKIVGTLADNQLRLDGGIEGLADTEFAVAAAIPLQPGKDNSFPTLSQTAPIYAELTWIGPVRQVVEYLSLDQHSVTGNADIKLRLNGHISAPSINGFARLRDGVYENFQTGTLIKDLTLDLDDNGSEINLSGSGNDGAGGLLKIRGGLDMASGEMQKFPVDLKLELEKFMLVRRHQLSASVSGEIGLGGNLSELRLTSRLSTEQVDASLTASSGSQVESLEVIEKNLPSGSRNGVKSSAPGGNLVPINLELALNMPRRVFLRGGGLDSEWAGNLDVTGTAQNPVVSGALQPVRGGYTFFGKQFSLNTGSVRFNGEAGFDPILNLPFEYRGGDFTADLTISGPASNPKLLLSSRPAMPESEIMSRVLFGRTAGTLTRAQQLQLATAVASIKNGNLSVIERTRDRLGLDTLSLNENDAQNTTLTAGKYLTERVYLEVGKGADRGDSSATVEVEISPNVKVQTGTRGGDSGSVGLQWRWDY
jgi:translocation and assembly module TamB